MADLKEVFQQYGADYETTMARFTGNEQMYLKILSMLPRDKNLHRLDQALQAGDYPAAFDAAHTLKGMAGNLGLTPLYQAVCAIVEPLRAGEKLDYSPLYLSVQKEYEQAVALLELLRREQNSDMPN